MTVMESYLIQRRQAVIRMWIGYALANLACLGAMALMLYL